MCEILTVGNLKKALENVPDNVPVKLVSDTGIDIGHGEIIVEDAFFANHIEKGQRIQFLGIYVNGHTVRKRGK